MTKILNYRAKINNPITDVAQIESWLISIANSTGENIFNGPFANKVDDVDNNGANGNISTELSRFYLYVWDQTSPASLKLSIATESDLTEQQFLSSLQQFDPIEIVFDERQLEQ